MARVGSRAVALAPRVRKRPAPPRLPGRGRGRVPVHDRRRARPAQQARRRGQGRCRRAPRVGAARPRGRRRARGGPDRAAHLHHPAAPAGWDGARVLGAGPRGAVGHRADAPAARRVARARGRGAERVPRLRLPADDRGLRRAAGRAGHPGPDPLRRGGRHHRRALPQRPAREDRPGADHASARGQVQPRVRRRLPGGLHARGRLRAPRPRVHLHVGGNPRRGRRVALPRPRAQPHAQHLPRPLRRHHRARAGREGRPTSKPSSSSTRSRRRSPTSSASSSASTAAPSPAIRRR